MKRKIVYIAVAIFAISTFAGCGKEEIKDIDEELIETFEVIKLEDDSNSSSPVTDSLTEDKNGSSIDENKNIADKFEIIDFYLVSGIYSRNVIQEDIEVLEMFALDRNSFVRVASDDLEREVYAYNYSTDDFTYLYYFDGELTLKTVINVATGAVIEDGDGNASVLLEDSAALKEYFYSLIKSADIEVSELKS